jgi:hypothetical protein
MKHLIPLTIILAIVAAVGCTTYRAPLNIPGAEP